MSPNVGGGFESINSERLNFLKNVQFGGHFCYALKGDDIASVSGDVAQWSSAYLVCTDRRFDP